MRRVLLAAALAIATTGAARADNLPVAIFAMAEAKVYRAVCEDVTGPMPLSFAVDMALAMALAGLDMGKADHQQRVYDAFVSIATGINGESKDAWCRRIRHAWRNY